MLRRKRKQWEILTGAEETSAREKCIKQLALNAAVNAKFHSSLEKASLFIAGNVTGKEEGSNSLILVN